MHPSIFDQMLDHVRAIYRTALDAELEVPSAVDKDPPTSHEVARRFAELEHLARKNPKIAERVAPFSFAPPLDVIITEREVIVEVGLPDVDEDEVQAEVSGELLIVSGSRSGGSDVNGRTYFHAEVPRGPFSRVV